MASFREQLLFYLWEGYRDFMLERKESCLLLDYLRDERTRTFRLAVKRAYRKWVQANPDTRRERAGALVRLLVDTLLGDGERLKGRKGKCLPLCERTELAPLVEAGQAAGMEPWRPYAPSGRTSASKTREALRAVTDDVVLADEDLVALVRAALESDVRNKNFGPAERLLELEEDRRTGRLALCAIDPAGQKDHVVRALKKVPVELRRRAGVVVGRRATGRGVDWDAWWDNAIEAGDVDELRRAADCFLLAQAEQFLSNAGLSVPERMGASDDGFEANRDSGTCRPRRLMLRTRDLPVRLVERYLQERRILERGVRPSAEASVQLFDAMAACRDEGTYDDAFVPLAIDQKTGGGIFAMGCNQVARYDKQCRDLAYQFPVVDVAPALIDHHLPHGHTVLPRVVAPFGLAGVQSYSGELWRLAIDDLQAQFERMSEPPQSGSVRARGFWEAYRKCAAVAPEGCPNEFLPYFVPSEAEISAMRQRPLSLEDYDEDLEIDDQAVVPRRIVDYFRAECQNPGSEPVCSFFEHDEIAAHMDSFGSPDVLGTAHVVLCSRRSQDMWSRIVQDALLNASFQRFCARA